MKLLLRAVEIFAKHRNMVKWGGGPWACSQEVSSPRGRNREIWRPGYPVIDRAGHTLGIRNPHEARGKGLQPLMLSPSQEREEGSHFTEQAKPIPGSQTGQVSWRWGASAGTIKAIEGGNLWG